MLAYELQEARYDATNPGDVAGYVVERKENTHRLSPRQLRNSRL
jgi:hypothetical protein